MGSQEKALVLPGAPGNKLHSEAQYGTNSTICCANYSFSPACFLLVVGRVSWPNSMVICGLGGEWWRHRDGGGKAEGDAQLWAMPELSASARCDGEPPEMR